jgi:hypothetical protein
MKRVISYSRTVGSNEGMPDYSNKIMSAEVELSEGISIEEGLITLQYSVDKALGLIKKETPVKKKKVTKKKVVKKETPVEVDEDGEEWFDDSEEIDYIEKNGKDQIVEEKPAAKKKVTRKKKVKKVTVITYDRSNPKHKKLMGDVTTKILGDDWMQVDAKKQKVRKFSRQMEGEDFINGEGEVAESFIEKYSELLK